MIEYSALVIDDDIWMQRILQKTLSSYGFSAVYLANNGIDGVAMAIENKPTIIFLDIMLPELSGHIVMRILKRINLIKHIPIFIVSALSDVENLGLTVKYGASGYITKPFTRTTIYDKLVDVFGKERMDMIALGEKIDDIFVPEMPKDTKPNITNNSDDILKTKSDLLNELDNTFKPDNKPIIPAEKFNQHYLDDDKKSLEAIRKMLLKNK